MDRQPPPRRGALRQFLLFLLLLALVAWFVEIRREGQERQRYEAQGLILTVGEQRRHLVCTGTTRAGVPPVVLEAGAGESHLAWAAVQAALAAETRVCSYDRPGYGWSDPLDGPRPAGTLAAELHDLLPQAGLAPPYLLVGQGLGAVVVQRFAQEYPEAVTGLVLVAPPDTSALLIQPGPVRALMVEAGRGPFWLRRVLAPFGGMRWLVRSGLVGARDALPEEARAPSRALAYRAQTWRTALAEHGAMGQNAVALQEGGPLPPVPVTIIVPAGERSPIFAEERRVLEAPVAESRLHITHPTLVVEAVEEQLGNPPAGE